MVILLAGAATAVTQGFSWRLPRQLSAPKRRPNYATGLLPSSPVFAPATKPRRGAHRSIVEKNRLTAVDAQQVEEAFQARLATGDEPDAQLQPVAPHRDDAASQRNRARSKTIDKSALALPEPRRVRDRDHVNSVAKKPCLICGR